MYVASGSQVAQRATCVCEAIKSTVEVRFYEQQVKNVGTGRSSYTCANAHTHTLTHICQSCTYVGKGVVEAGCRWLQNILEHYKRRAAAPDDERIAMCAAWQSNGQMDGRTDSVCKDS